MEYLGHTVNFKTHRKSYKIKKKVQTLRQNRRRMQKCEELNPFSGMVYCADYGAKMYLNRWHDISKSQEHLKCGTYSKDSSECSAYFIRTAVLQELVLKELNKLLKTVKEREDEFIQLAMEKSESDHADNLKKAKQTLRKDKKRIEELNKLFTRLYEDNVTGRITDKRFTIMSKTYEDEQHKLKEETKTLSAFIEAKKQKNENIAQFIGIVRKYEYIKELTPELMHELIDHIEVHAPDKSSGHRQQKVDIYFRFKITAASAVISRKDYVK